LGLLSAVTDISETDSFWMSPQTLIQEDPQWNPSQLIQSLRSLKFLSDTVLLVLLVQYAVLLCFLHSLLNSPEGCISQPPSRKAFMVILICFQFLSPQMVCRSNSQSLTLAQNLQFSHSNPSLLHS
jgi:hypothetical protein